MRFLCFHGRGTSAEIFEAQIASIRADLGEHEFVFLDGDIVVRTDGTHSLINGFAGWNALKARTNSSPGCSDSEDGPDGGLFGYFEEPIDANHCRDLIEGLKDAAQSQGPFDGLVGFSEGGIVAATLLVEDARRPFAGFRCGILFSAAPPLDPDDIRSGIVRCMDPVRDGVVVRVPTAHIYSHEMDVAASKGQACVGGNVKSPLHELWAQAGLDTPEQIHASLARLCDESHVFVHDQGHQVPGSRSREALRGALRAIDRTIQSAQA